ncbi:MAG TPA: 16S rRNA (cytosine(967)-C(5))-methyltransferase RsmB [Candidatus Acidoferrales bacterium]|nr:16S rRNA (cytosine(967)-C(5))-methyltransferase RsmB [Candidatus Acidoferrales bacterium]
MRASTEANASKSLNRKSARALALDVLLGVERQRAYADRLLEAALEKTPLDRRERALVTELVYGTLRWRGRIDWAAQQFLPAPLAEMKAALRTILRLTLYQVMFLSKIPAYAAVSEGVELAKRFGGTKQAALINAVARRVVREKGAIRLPSQEEDPVRHLAVAWSHPEWLVRLWMDYLPGEDIAALLEANNREAPVSLRVNSLTTTRAALLERLRAHGVRAALSRWSPVGLRLTAAGAVDRLAGFPEGDFQVQGEPSQLVGYLLDPQPGERVLDACAAPGGKTTHLAELMRDQGEIVALDLSSRGLEKLKENVQRLKLASVKIFRADATRELPKGCPRAYERILVDAPCTGLGTLRSHPEAKWHRAAGDIRRLAELQRTILKSVVRYLKPGGVLVYATCTLTPEENEGVVEGFLQSDKGMVLEDSASVLPEAATAMTRGKYFFALPHRHDTDGFFAARMRKL